MKAGRIIVLTVVFVLLATWAYADDCGGGWRYADNLDGTITDCRTGLIWLKNAKCTDTSNGIANSNGYLTWYEAMKWVAGLHSGLCQLSDFSTVGDWRLPTRTEWMAMITGAKSKGFTQPVLTNWAGDARWTNGNPFFDVQVFGYYWSSTTVPWNKTSTWAMDIADGPLDQVSKSLTEYVWPVRAGQVAGNDASFGTLTVE